MYGGSGICPRLVQDLLEDPFVFKMDQTISFLHNIHHFSD